MPDAGRRTPTAGQNPGATKIPIPLRAGDKKEDNASLMAKKGVRTTWLGYKFYRVEHIDPC